MNKQELKQSIGSVIKNNGNREITGDLLRDQLYEIIDGGGLIKTTYAELKALRDAGQLSEGAFYRITDYETTTTQANTDVAGHHFDIVVQALDAHTLSENARAASREGEDYFSRYGSKVEAWQLLYSLDNDKARFAWADETNGKGVIFRMTDEYNNECPYDFKNILFKRWLIKSATNSEVYIDSTNIVNRYYSTQSNSYSFGTTSITPDPNAYKMYYTFSGESGPGTDIQDASVTGQEAVDYQNKRHGVTDNRIGICSISNASSDFPKCSVLPNNVFIGIISRGFYGITGNIIAAKCWDNTIAYQAAENIRLDGNCCQNLLISTGTCEMGFSCTYNLVIGGNVKFGEKCSFNCRIEGSTTIIFGNACLSNTIGYSCENISFGSNCSENILNQRCENNIFEAEASNNKCGDYCENNVFRAGASNNTLGSTCTNNEFGQGSTYNTLNNNCSNNTFGPNANHNTLLGSCSRNTFGANARYNVFVTTSTSGIDIAANTAYVNIDGGGTFNNATILPGISGKSTAPIDINLTPQDYGQFVGKTSTGEIKIWNPADVA